MVINIIIKILHIEAWFQIIQYMYFEVFTFSVSKFKSNFNGMTFNCQYKDVKSCLFIVLDEFVDIHREKRR